MLKKVLKIIALIVVIVLIVFIINMSRKINIISKYCKKVDEYQKATNFYAKFEDEYGSREVWRKEDKGITKDISDNGTTMICIDGDKLWNIMDMKDENGNQNKIESQSEEGNETAFLPIIEDGTFYVEDNLWEKIKAAFTVRISTENVNGKECYKFTINKDFQIYVNKTDYMKIKETNSGTTTELKEYSFNSVEDKDVEKPSLEGYEIIN